MKSHITNAQLHDFVLELMELKSNYIGRLSLLKPDIKLGFTFERFDVHTDDDADFVEIVTNSLFGIRLNGNIFIEPSIDIKNNKALSSEMDGDSNNAELMTIKRGIIHDIFTLKDKYNLNSSDVLFCFAKEIHDLFIKSLSVEEQENLAEAFEQRLSISLEQISLKFSANFFDKKDSACKDRPSNTLRL